jgi:Pyruvate/2-oxoacid:ferredoxin oxidoreductase delta subunit
MHEYVVGGIVFNPEACKGCGLCVETCQSKARRMSPEVNSHGVRPAHVRGEFCTRCGTCYYFCPELGANMIAAPRKDLGRAGRYFPAA